MSDSPVSQEFMKPDDKVLLLLSEPSSFDVRVEIVQPSQSTALAAPVEPCRFATNQLQVNPINYFLSGYED